MRIEGVCGELRGWVAVLFRGFEKMAELLSAIRFEAHWVKYSAAQFLKGLL